MLFLIGQAIMKLDTQKWQYLCFVTFENVCGILQNSEILFLKFKKFIVPYENILKSLTCYTTFM